MQLEAGYEGEFNNSDYDFTSEYFDQSQQAFVIDKAKTNRFLYDDAIHALYGTWRQSFGKFGFQAGLRAEQVYTTSNLVTLDSTMKNEYFSLFPTLHLSYKFSPMAELQLNYSRRTRRPDGDDLNPFPEYRDPRNIQAGNPRLLPEYIHSFELGCQLQNQTFSLLPSLYYRYTMNRFTQVTQVLNDSVLLTTETNLEKDQSAGMELVLSANTGEWFSAHLSGNAFYNRIDASNLGYGENKSTISWSSALMVKLNFAKSTALQMNANFNSRRLTPQGEISPSYSINMGFRQELLENSLSVVLTVSDIFQTMKREMILNTPALKQTSVNTRDSRVIYLGMTYTFGRSDKKSKEEQIKYEEGL
jgi:outer membrane receptor protein involved in Fe transport